MLDVREPSLDHERRLADLETQVGRLSRNRRGSAWRSRWAAIGAAVAVTLGGSTALHFALAAPGDVVPTAYVPLPPTRILDTRPAPENVGGFVGPLETGTMHTFQVTGVAGVPANATAVVMNVTVDLTTGPSYLTVFPAGTTRPLASNLNWKAAKTTIPNLVTVKLGAGGQVSVFNQSGQAHVIADVAGYYAPANDKFISLDVFGNDGGTAAFVAGRGDLAGLRFLDGAANSTSFHFVLPPDYTAGGAIVGTFTWHTASTSCDVYWRANYVSVSRSGQIHVVGPSPTTGMSDPTPITAGTTPNLVQTSTFTLGSPLPPFSLQPGDSYTFGLYRNSADGCTATALIDSMVIRYE